MNVARRLSPFCLMVLSACASYHAVPLATALPAPDSALSVLAAQIERPYLKPQQIDLKAPLTPNALAVIAVLENLDLKALRTRAAVADAQSFAARLLPDPTLQLGADKVLSGPDELTALAGSLGFDLAMLRSHAAQRAKNAALEAQVRGDIAWAEWQTSCNARLQGTRVNALSTQVPIAQASAESTQQLFDVASRAAQRGDIARNDLDGKRLAALDAANALRGIQRDLAAARLELNRMLGLPPETTLILAPNEFTETLPPVEALATKALNQRFDLQALRKGYDAAEADARLAVIQQFPNLSLNLNTARDTTGNHTAGAQIGFALPLWNRNRGGIAVADATRAQLHAEYDARLFQTRADIAAVVTALNVLGMQRAALGMQIPALERSAAGALKAAAHGDVSRVVAEAAAQLVRDRKLAMLQLDQSITEQMIALELLSGSPRASWKEVSTQ
jgi:outer membrane protein TolC